MQYVQTVTGGGWGTSALAAEQLERRWITTEQMAEYIAGHALRMRHCEGFLTSFDMPLRG